MDGETKSGREEMINDRLMFGELFFLLPDPLFIFIIDSLIANEFIRMNSSLF